METAAGTIGGHTFMPPAYADAGEVTCTFHFDPDVSPPLNTAAETLQITWPKYTGDATAANWAATGCFLTSCEVNDPLEDIMTITATWKISGNITVTPSVLA
jgi:hypothetical protein